MKHRRHSLSVKLSLGILLLAVLMFVMSLGILSMQSRNFIRQEATERVNSMLITTLQRMNNYMTAVETATNSNMWLVEKYFQPDSLLSLSHRIVSLNRHVYGCSICSVPDFFPQEGRGFSVYTVNTGDTLISIKEPQYDYFNKAWFKKPLELGKACWIDPYDEYTDGTLNPLETIASYCRPIYLPDEQAPNRQRVAGVISTDLSFYRLSELLDSVERPSPNAYYILISSDGRFLVHPDSTTRYSKTIFAGKNLEEHSDMIALGYEMMAGNEGTMHINADNTRYHVAFCPVPGTRWSLALICPDRDLLRNYRHQAYIVDVLILLGLLFIVWLSYRNVKKAIRPLDELVETSQVIASGKYDIDIPHSDREDAVGRLQNSFVTMQQSLRHHMGSIRETVNQMQQRNEELAQTMKQAEESLLQKSHFIAEVSHQIRTPLNIIQGFVEVLRNELASAQNGEDKEDALKEEEVRGIAGIIEHQAHILNRMLLMLYDSSDLGIDEETRLERNDIVSCNEVARESIDFTMFHFPDITLRMESTLSDDYQIRTNYLYLMRTIRELLYNAAKFSDKQHIVMRVEQDGESVLFIVEDVGPGLKEEREDVLYKPFTKNDDMSEGLGLGLPLCKRHAFHLGGDLIYDADYQEGCRFILKLPDVR